MIPPQDFVLKFDLYKRQENWEILRVTLLYILIFVLLDLGSYYFDYFSTFNSVKGTPSIFHLRLCDYLFCLSLFQVRSYLTLF